MSNLNEALDSLLMSIGYTCMAGPAFHRASNELDGSKGIWGHPEDRPGVYLVEARWPSHFEGTAKLMACRECKDVFVNPLFLAAVGSGLEMKVVSGPIGEGPWPK